MRRKLYEALGRVTWRLGKKYGPGYAKRVAARVGGGTPHERGSGGPAAPRDDPPRGGTALNKEPE